MANTLKMYDRGSPRYDAQVLAGEISKVFELDLPASMILEDGVYFDSDGTIGFLEITIMKVMTVDDWRRILNVARVYEGEEVKEEVGSSG